MTLPRGLVDQATAAKIKVDLWAGHMTQSNIALRYNVSQPTISRIFRGRDWRDLPWPDGSLGHIPKDRRALIHASRHRNTRYQHDSRSGNTEMQAETISDIDKVLENLLAVEDSKLRDVINKKATETHQKAKRDSGKGDMLPWPDIKEIDPGHPIVQRLSGEEDQPLKVALRIVCAKVPQADWQRPEVLQMVEDEAEKIRGRLK